MPEWVTPNGVSVLFDNNDLERRPDDPPNLSFDDEGNLTGVRFDGYYMRRKTHDDAERERCETVAVVIPDFLFEAGEISEVDPNYFIDEDGRRCLRLDKCIVPALEALWVAGIVTRGCCCGHGNRLGDICFPPHGDVARDRSSGDVPLGESDA